MASGISSMDIESLRKRYHELVDCRLRNELSPLENFELERIETRLDTLDQDPKLEADDQEWAHRRTELLDSVIELVRRLQV